MSQLCLGRGVAKLLAGACALLLAACAGNFPRRPSSAQFPEQPGLPSRRTTATDADALILLSIEENGFAHLFVYGPPVRPLTRLTYGAWNDAAPSPSPDGGRIAFASDRNGSWDLYVLDIQSGEVIQLTDTPEYDSAPAWSPDGRWLAFETYLDDNLELAILPLDGSDEAPIRLTNDPAADHSPAWSPDGRRIAFVSTRGQGSDIWLAELDRVEAERFRNLTNTPKAAERYPAWSPDGSKMIWYTMSQDAGFSGIYLLEIKDGLGPPRWIGDGARATWNTAGDQVLASLTGPNQSYLTAFDLNGGLALPPIVLPGVLRGLASAHMELPDSLPASLAGPAAETPVALWAPAVTPASNVPARRWYLVDLEGVEAPYPQLHDLVDESFSALRERVLQESGWDALASLENAFVPLSTALDPGLQEDWLYTGRAFAMNTLMGNAGWMVVVREDFGARTYWRVYLRCTLQDGSLGEPLHDSPWDLSARYELDPLAYEEGGRFGAVPSGYWVDITALAAAYRWERLPALPNWRSYYGGTRFTEFALTGGLEWYRAMLELYPADALITPTRVMPPTNTPTRPPPSSATPAPTRTPRPTATPSQTMTPSATPLPSPTPPTIIP